MSIELVRLDILVRLHKKIVDTLGDEDYFGGPSYSPPPVASRHAIADAIIGYFDEMEFAEGALTSDESTPIHDAIVEESK